MGQYFRAMTQYKNIITVYNRNIKHNGKEEYTVAKLTEHAWWRNNFVNAVCLDVYRKQEPVCIAWIGDYADNVESLNGLDKSKITKLFNLCWDCKGTAVTPTDFTLQNLYLINHSKKQFVDCNEYFKNSVVYIQNVDWCFHPLPLLTCIGNGLGCGDFNHPTNDSTMNYVGAWAWDKISITDNCPKNYDEINLLFKERGWGDDD